MAHKNLDQGIRKIVPCQKTKFIHIGHHKTASTFIQTELIPKIHDLKQVPGKCPDGQSNTRLRRAWINLVQCSDIYFELDEARQAFAEVEFNCISNEAFVGFGSLEAANGGHIDQSARRLRELFGETKILFVIRNQQNLIKSLYVDDVEFGYAASFQDWFQTRLFNRQFDWFKFAPIIQTYQNYFGEANVRVEMYETIFTPGRFKDILLEFDVDPAGLENVNFDRRVNPGLNSVAVSASRLVNRFIGTRANMGNGFAYRFWTDRIRHVVNSAGVLFGATHPTLNLDEFEDDLQQLFARDNQLVADLTGLPLESHGYIV